jgi:hypothetical protein
LEDLRGRRADRTMVDLRLEMRCPFRVIHDRVEAVANPVMSAVLPKAEVNSKH